MIERTKHISAAIAASVAGVFVTAPAFAHHVMGGRLPETWSEGLLSGLGHPVIGLDHLAAIVAVGLLAASLRQGLLLPLAFVIASSVGAALHVMAVDVPFAEGAVAVTVIVLGALLLRGEALPAATLAGLFAIAGLFHGYAFGESIVGAERAPLAAYFIGFTAIQYAIAAAALLIARRLGAPAGRRLVPGGAIAAIGLLFLGIAVVSV
jgi:urease accessory protein